MANTAAVVIKFLGDAKGAEKAAKDASGAVGSVGKGVSKLTGPAVAAAGAVAGIAIAAGKAASDAQQSVGSVESVFGRFANTVVASSEKAAQSVGLSANAYRELAAKIGGQLKNAGVPMDQIAAKTDTLIRQGADLAATFGGSTADAVDSLSAALRGEADPAERYALALNQNTVNAKILADTTARLTAEAAKAGKPFKSQADATAAAKKAMNAMTPDALRLAKTQATMALVSQQSADSMGQFGREADTAQGQQQRMAAATQDAAAALGQALLPAMTAAAAIIASVTGWMKQNTTATWVIIGVIAALAAGILILNGVMTVYTAVTTLAASATVAAWMAAALPVVLVIAAVLAVIAVIVLLWNKCAAFRNAVLAIWNGIRAAITAVANTARAVWAAVWPALSAGLRLIGALFRVQFAIISVVVRLAAAVIGAVFRVAFGILRAVAGPVFALIRAGFTALRPVITAVASALSGPLSAAFRAVGAAAHAVGSAIASGFGVIQSVVNGAISAVESLIGWLNKIHVPSIHIPGLSSSSVAPGATAAPRLGGTATRGVAAPSTGPVFIIQAVDPEAAARTINRIQRRHAQRVGLTGTIRTA